MSLQIRRDNDLIEITDFSEGGGSLIRCYPDGRIELYEVPQYGGEERFCDYYPTINAALKEGDTWT